MIRRLAARVLFAATLGVANLAALVPPAVPIVVTLGTETNPDALGYVVWACPDVPEYCPEATGPRWTAVVAVVATQCEPMNPCRIPAVLPYAAAHWTFVATALGATQSAPSNLWVW